jgi:exopolyphosphatase/guanosine-5'-triphosphate,3'-diphosphate pyrophosphatase
MKRATIDIGSNSILLLIAEVEEGKFEELENEAHITGLGKGVDKSGNFLKKSMDDTLSALNSYKEKILEHDVKIEDVVVTATEASRVAKNSKAFFNTVREKLGFIVHIISAEGEAYYTAMAVCKGQELKNVAKDSFVIMDIGGASTELIKVDNRKVSTSISLPMGAVRMTEWIEENSMPEFIGRFFQEHSLEDFKTKYLYCVAGTMTSLGAMDLQLRDYKDELVHGKALERERLCSLLDTLQPLNVEQINERYPFLNKRAETIIGGMNVAILIGEYLEVETYEISTWGLRYGTALEGVIQETYLHDYL